MSANDWYLLCFAFGFTWTIASLLLGSFHVHGHAHGGHSHVHGHAHVHNGHVHAHAHGHASHQAKASASLSPFDFLNVHSIAIFLGWFGGCAYLLNRHTGLAFYAVLLVAILAGLTASFLVVSLLRFLAGRDHTLDPFDYRLIGAVGRITSPVRAGGTGELIIVQDGARKSYAARSEDSGVPLERNVEVVVTRFEKGIAYVRTWDAFTDTERQ